MNERVLDETLSIELIAGWASSGFANLVEGKVPFVFRFREEGLVRHLVLVRQIGDMLSYGNKGYSLAQNFHRSDKLIEGEDYTKESVGGVLGHQIREWIRHDHASAKKAGLDAHARAIEHLLTVKKVMVCDLSNVLGMLDRVQLQGPKGESLNAAILRAFKVEIETFEAPAKVTNPTSQGKLFEQVKTEPNVFEATWDTALPSDPGVFRDTFWDVDWNEPADGATVVRALGRVAITNQMDVSCDGLHSIVSIKHGAWPPSATVTGGTLLTSDSKGIKGSLLGWPVEAEMSVYRLFEGEGDPILMIRASALGQLLSFPLTKAITEAKEGDPFFVKGKRLLPGDLFESLDVPQGKSVLLIPFDGITATLKGIEYLPSIVVLKLCRAVDALAIGGVVDLCKPPASERDSDVPLRHKGEPFHVNVQDVIDLEKRVDNVYARVDAALAWLDEMDQVKGAGDAKMDAQLTQEQYEFMMDHLEGLKGMNLIDDARYMEEKLRLFNGLHGLNWNPLGRLHEERPNVTKRKRAQAERGAEIAIGDACETALKLLLQGGKNRSPSEIADFAGVSTQAVGNAITKCNVRGDARFCTVAVVPRTNGTGDAKQYRYNADGITRIMEVLRPSIG